MQDHVELRERTVREVNALEVLPQQIVDDPSKLTSILDTADRIGEKIATTTPPKSAAREVAIQTYEAAVSAAASLIGGDGPFTEILLEYVRKRVRVIEEFGLPTTMHDVFICHSSEDKELARRLANDLSEKGYRVWFDEFSMLPGDSLYDKIQSGIKDSAWFVIVLSPNSVESKWCKRELHNAMEEELERNNVYVVPVLCKDCEVPGFLKEKLWADCRGRKYKKGLSQIISRLQSQPCT